MWFSVSVWYNIFDISPMHSDIKIKAGKGNIVYNFSCSNNINTTTCIGTVHEVKFVLLFQQKLHTLLPKL